MDSTARDLAADVHLALHEAALEVFAAVQIDEALYVALDTQPMAGSAVLPFAVGEEGSTTFLPFRADRLVYARREATGLQVRARTHERTMWGEREDAGAAAVAVMEGEQMRLRIPIPAGTQAQFGVAVFRKDLTANHGWGALQRDLRFGAKGGVGDQYITRYELVELAHSGAIPPATRGRRACASGRVRIYQLLPRLFGNINETRRPNGTLEENGVGKFNDINDAALAAIRELGCTHVWLTGVMQQATSTDYTAFGEPADDPDLLKGLAGSPYAIKDYFDLCPDYAVDPASRFPEFHALLERIHAAGLRAIIDFIPNHVARSHHSSIRPDLSFGTEDDRRHFFHPKNNFFWLQPDSPGGGPPLRLPTVSDGIFLSPTCLVLGEGDGLFIGEMDCGRVTGNNSATWRPSAHDWYETVKLNYGYDFTTGQRAYPQGVQRGEPVPDTWAKMDAILAYWQEQGVDGFRCDMAHLVPPEFWAWALSRARERRPEVFFAAEAYDNDPAKVPGGDPLLAALDDHRGNVKYDLLAAGFDAVYDDPSYKRLKAIYDGGGWANDLDEVLGGDFIFHNSLRYAENHDEVRLASPREWGGAGMQVGRPVSAVLFGIGRGPVLLYSGQEVGEPAAGVEGFGGDDARTTIFDYWSMPELVKWVNGHRYDGGRLSPEQRELRAFYARLLRLVGEPAFRDGEFFSLNGANLWNASAGRLPGESASGHWLYAFLRYDPRSKQRFLIAVNFHPAEPLHDVVVHLSPDALTFLDWSHTIAGHWQERLAVEPTPPVPVEDPARISIGTLPPLTPYYFELLIAPR